MIDPEDADTLLQQLERLGQTLGIIVRYEILGDEDDSSPIRSGACRLNDNNIFLIDKRLPTTKRCLVLINELKRFNLSYVFVPPAIRRLIEGSEGEL
ncbi:MAG: hypothetical protein GY847_10995 [Proteobacteria bacterium]|nr:hypothetical protein [Pseudomonadota bacterium]